MAKDKIPVTQAVRVLKQHKIDFEPFIYTYEEKGGTEQFAKLFQIDEHLVIKTLVFCPEGLNPVVVLMHGNSEVSVKKLAAYLNVKKIEPCKGKTAFNWTDYQFGGTSPFGTKREMKVYVEESIFELEKIYVNGGKRGFIIGINPKIIENILPIFKVNVAIDK